jgi:acetylornithine deacetylase
MSEDGSVEILRRLVAFPTVSRESNLALIDWVRDTLRAHGVEAELFHNAERTKASLYATIGPDIAGGVVLSGHTDVVPVEGQAWTVDPFKLSENEGRLHGRGTADMKGFIACVLAAVPAFTARELRMPVHIALSYDEEVGCLGVRPMLAELAQRPARPGLCLIGEPTRMRPVLGHKGKIAMRCRVRGAACHSAYTDRGVNAIEYAARLVHRLTRIGDELADPAHHDARFDPPFSTVQTGLIQGGRALNIVPEDCQFDFEVRSVPGFDAQSVPQRLHSFAEGELLPRMRAVSASAGIDFQTLTSYPALSTSPESEAADLVAMLCASRDYDNVSYCSEGGQFSLAGIPSVLCGPGSMDQGHKPDEYVTREQLSACDAMLARLVHHVRSPEAPP